MSKLLPVHQLSNFSRRNRHPEFVCGVRDLFVADGVPMPDVRVLSFGCAGGAECGDIAQHWPQSLVDGTDVNQEILVKTRRHKGPRTNFYVATEENILAAGPYDAIFAMNVLCSYPATLGLENIGEVYPFALYASALGLLDRALRPGGVLVAYNAVYFFEDSEVAPRYEGVSAAGCDKIGLIEKCAPNGDRVTDVRYGYEGRTYSRAEWAALDLPSHLPEGARYWHEWVDPDRFRGRSLTTAIWRKRASADAA